MKEIYALVLNGFDLPVLAFEKKEDAQAVANEIRNERTDKFPMVKKMFLSEGGKE